jgi:hypothetical protein
MEKQKELGIESGTHLHNLTSLLPEDARCYLSSLWSEITDPAVAAVRDSLATYSVAGIRIGSQPGNLRVVLGPILVGRFQSERYLYVGAPLSAPPPVPDFLSATCACEFYRFFPGLAPRPPHLSLGFTPPDEFYPFHGYGYYDDPEYLEQDRETRLHWRDSWIIYENGDVTSILMREDGEIGAFALPEMAFSSLFYGFDKLMLRVARTYRMSTELSFYEGLLGDPEP